MDKKLLKQLKDSGYRLREFNNIQVGFELGFETVDEFRYYNPKLSELIESIGEPFYSLTQEIKGRWSACGYGLIKKGKPTIIRKIGKSPEEAVTKLYIELKKSK